MKSKLKLPSLLTLALFAFACGGGENNAETATATDAPLIPVSTSLTSDATTGAPVLDSTAPPASATSPGSPGGAELVPSATGGATVLVTIAENALGVRTVVPRGPVVFTVTNTGRQEHSLRITGSGIEQQLPDLLQASQANSMTVNLVPGTYQLVCPISDHATNEKATLTVSP